MSETPIPGIWKIESRYVLITEPGRGYTRGFYLAPSPDRNHWRIEGTGIIADISTARVLTGRLIAGARYITDGPKLVSVSALPPRYVDFP